MLVELLCTGNYKGLDECVGKRVRADPDADKGYFILERDLVKIGGTTPIEERLLYFFAREVRVISKSDILLENLISLERRKV